MLRKLTSFALPLSLALMLIAPAAHAATPMATFGVTVTVVASCSASATTMYGSFSAALEHATSSVNVNCSNTTQYSIAVIADTESGMRMPAGNLVFPVRSLMNYAMPSASARNLASGETAETPLVASSANSDKISVAITY